MFMVFLFKDLLQSKMITVLVNMTKPNNPGSRLSCQGLQKIQVDAKQVWMRNSLGEQFRGYYILLWSNYEEYEVTYGLSVPSYPWLSVSLAKGVWE